MKTYQPTQKDIKRFWHLIDAKGEVLGRLSSQIVNLLMGKQKAGYSRHIDCGDFVVVVNAEKVKVTGRKESQKTYKSHSGYPGWFKEIPFTQMIREHPESVIEHSVAGMLPNNRLKQKRMSRLKLVVGDKNPYEERMKNG